MGFVVSIVFTPRARAGRPQSHYVRVAADRVNVIANRGIEGDAKGRPGDRQINIMAAEIVEQLQAEGLHAAPGELGEQIVIRGIEPLAMAPGARLQLGEAVVEVAMPRTGCERFETIQGRSRKSVSGRLGVLVKVMEGGSVGVGDSVRLFDSR